MASNESSKPVVGFIGLGAMGAPMAARLQAAGYPLVVHDRREEAIAPLVQAGAMRADTPRGVAQQCAVIFSCLPDLAQIEAVALGQDGILSGAHRGQSYFEMSTSSPALVRQLHSVFAQQGVDLLDAPVSGGPRGARRGRLAIWVGGDKRAYERHEPVLQAMADHPSHLGPCGAGLVAKLVHNCTSQATQAAIAEIFSLGVKAGADPLALWRAVRQGAIGRRRTFDGLIDQFLPAEYDTPQAVLDIMHKDTLAATELGRELGVPLRIANLALADIQEAMNRGWAQRDGRCVMLLPQERAGVSIRVDPRGIREALHDDPPAPTDTRHGAEPTLGERL
ncbi:NAD(P)-dependent oxidoreductase [Variovorax saccharolyticus]|uniref:NAD(P)-dependent oxidoreductase n=1 Tax=Variovorax saccharolyticus TaxID=3053516 RepID=UPI002578F715|nr:NAD(P)-dependent oxidoreductase [Variovorax sp. J22R187]MDM0021792.1 NAD(P)-dependent oxidoreductase [Variovorax sp. J22R187]